MARIKKSNNNILSTFSTPVAIILAGALIAGGLYLGLRTSPIQKSKTDLNEQEENQPTNIVTIPQAKSPGLNVQNGETEAATIVRVSVDDDAVLGDTDAPVTMIEFSDYECPFCKNSFELMLPSLKKNYINTGKVKYIFRDTPLPFHEPIATKEALAANCAREQQGDAGYFKYHDEIFTRTTSNMGLIEDDLYIIAEDLKLDAEIFRSCLESEKYQDEIEKDKADAQVVGATGTPTFFIGQSTEDGIIDGEMIRGALPYSAIKQVVDQYLEE